MRRAKIFRILTAVSRQTAGFSRGRSPLRGLILLVILGSLLPSCTWLREFLGTSPEKSRRLAEQARRAEEAGQIAQAVALFETALKETPNDPQLHRAMARLMKQQHNPEAALKHLQRAVKYNPDDVEAPVELAAIYVERGQDHLALEPLEFALQNDPQHTEALLMRAKLAERQGDPRMAIETYHRVLSAAPHDVEARMRIAALQLEADQPHLAAPLLRSVCQCSHADNEQIAEAQWSLGVAYGQEQRWADAVLALSDATARRAELSADDWYRLAYAQSQLGDWEGARYGVGRALLINPHHEHSQAMLGVLEWQRHHPETPILRIGHSTKPMPVPLGW